MVRFLSKFVSLWSYVKSTKLHKNWVMDCRASWGSQLTSLIEFLLTSGWWTGTKSTLVTDKVRNPRQAVIKCLILALVHDLARSSSCCQHAHLPMIKLKILQNNPLWFPNIWIDFFGVDNNPTYLPIWSASLDGLQRLGSLSSNS